MFYYDDFGNVYKSRLDALQSGYQCYFYFHEKEFSKCDWTKEPTESLEELYRQRAQQIRDKYDYVVLTYSGGIDSTNILETFYYNNILIDEIVVAGALSQDQYVGSDENHNGDLYYNVFPTLKKLNLPNTKINIQDYSLYLDKPEKFSIIKECGIEYPAMIGSHQSVGHLFWNDIDKFITKKGRTALIFGMDKPRIGFMNDRPCFSHSDIAFVNFGNFQYKDGIERVPFYITPDFPQLTIKQHHILLKFVDLYVGQDKLIDYESYSTNNDKICDKLMYNLKNKLQFHSLRSTAKYLSNRDTFILNHKNSKIYDIWYNTVKNNFNKFDDTGMIPHLRSYYLR